MKEIGLKLLQGRSGLEKHLRKSDEALEQTAQAVMESPPLEVFEKRSVRDAI